ncbi:putative Secreted solute binding protein [metagenome]|uniref:Putative Secreted solute binding protein n=1 Tax=metagenome TaxID=256318 RepID=A0A2P2C0H9_9ZZZZ
MKTTSKLRQLSVVAGALLLAIGVSACGNNDDSGDGGGSTPSGDALKIVMISHSPQGSAYWTTVHNGAKAAAKDLNVDLTYEMSGGDNQKQIQLINSAVSEKPDAIVTSLSDPTAFTKPIGDAEAAGVPVFSMNSGTSVYKETGSLGHAGEDESVAGQGVGDKFNELGSKHILCVFQEQGNIGLDNYCNGIKSTFAGDYDSIYVPADSDPAGSLASVKAKLASDPSIDAVYSLALDLAPLIAKDVKASGSDVTVASWGFSGDTLTAIEDGSMAFAEDQQPFLQGYQSVEMAVLYARWGFQPGAAFLTGPNFITADKVDQLRELSKEGIR